MKRILTALATLALLSGLASDARAQQRMGSIYNPDVGPIGMISNRTARKVGDIVTVVVSESQVVNNEESTDLSRSTNLNYKINLFDIAPDAFDTLPAIAADSNDGFIGSAAYSKSGTFTARMAAIVVDTLPNGNLVITGRREIKIDEERKVIEFTGIVRRYDVQANNTVASELVANAQIIYQGSGPLSRATRRYGLGGWLHRLIAWLWPF